MSVETPAVVAPGLATAGTRTRRRRPGRTSLVRLCGLDQISTLVSDQSPPEAVAAELARHGVLVRVAAP